MKKQILLILSIFFISTLMLSAQSWVRKAEEKKTNPNFFDIQSTFQEYENSFEQSKTFSPVGTQPWEEESEIPGFFPYKRWEWFWESRVGPTGEFPNPNILLTELEKVNAKSVRDVNAASWTLMGPISAVPTGGGVGRINCVRFNPLNASKIWAGSPAGGLWKSTNGGTNWTTNTDQLTVLGVTDVAINPLDTNIMYIATGDGDATDTYSAGIMKSTDAGATWNTTGLTWNVSFARKISRLIINPVDPTILLAATSNGIYRTINSGTTWTSVKTGNHNDMEFMPGNPNIVYAASATSIYKSTDGGATWGAAITSGVATANVGRVAIAVTAANANVLYAIFSKADDDGFLAFYKSTNAAVSFTQMSTTPNVLGWSQTGNDVGGQGWYDLAIAASPTNENFVLVGGVHIWKSSNGGSTWTISAFNSVHADVHDIVFSNGSGSIAYTGCDGGVYTHPTVTGSGGWTNKSATLQIQQGYKLSTSQTMPNWVLTGTQDNGTNLVTAVGSVARVLGGDGMECIIDYTDENIMYAEYYYGDLNVSGDAGGNWTAIGPATDGAWVTPYVMHSSNPQTLYAGYTSIYRTQDGGNSWDLMTNTISTTYRSMAVAPSNGNYVYAASLSRIFRSSNAAATWTEISAGLPSSSAYISNIAVKYDDPLTLWVTFSGYSATIKVYKSTNGGATWTNITGTGLPSLPANCIVNQPGNFNEALYVGTDIGVYYKDNTLTSWVPFNTNLPRVIVSELEIQISSQKLRASTFGRGIWQSDLYSPIGIAETVHKDVLNVYPNPSRGFVNLEVLNNAEVSAVTFYDVLGKRVIEIYSPAVETNMIHVDISALPNGVYSVVLTSKSGVSSTKVSLVR